MNTSQAFKKCPGCDGVWQTRDAFLNDQALSLNGYKADFECLEYGLFFFTHMTPGCRSTLAIEVLDFLDMYSGEIHPERRTGEADCPGYCMDKDQLERCDAICECAFVREIMQHIKQRP